jgi:hypothetical protein
MALGKPKWRKNLPGVVDQLTVVGDRLYASAGAEIHCIRVRDGHLIWHASFGQGRVVFGS